MNTKTKFAIAVLAGAMAATMMVGVAYAAPKALSSAGFRGYGMMRSFDTSSTSDVPTFAEMSAFMGQYRSASGSIDFARMHADVVSGAVTPPCFVGATGSLDSSTTPTRSLSVIRPRTMMRGYTPSTGSTGYGMMGSRY